MMTRSITWLAAALALGGCATGQVGPRPATDPATTPRSQIHSLTYTTTPCHGFCPV